MLASSAPVRKVFAVVEDEIVFLFTNRTFGTSHNYITCIFRFRVSSVNFPSIGKFSDAFNFDSSIANLLAHKVYDPTISAIYSVMRVSYSFYEDVVALSHLYHLSESVSEKYQYSHFNTLRHLLALNQVFLPHLGRNRPPD